MSWPRPPLDLSKLKVFPLAQRQSLTQVEEILVDPQATPKTVPADMAAHICRAAENVRAARQRGAAVILFYGAHLLRNGAPLILDRLMGQSWITHLATNGAATIHDWEYAFLGRSTESVRDGVAHGCFGTWDETGKNLNLAILAAGLAGEGYGHGLGRFIVEDGVTLPDPAALQEAIRLNPCDELTPARADMLAAMSRHQIPGGRYTVQHNWKHASIVASAYAHHVPITVHPGIGYDIITNHPMFNGAAIGRAAQRDFAQLCGAVEQLNGGVVLSIGSAIMGPQVFEKSISCVNNLRLQQSKPIVKGHSIFVVDIQDGDGWDWSAGEPPKTNPAYYLRFCKSYARMGGAMHYLQCDNLLFIQHLFGHLSKMAVK